MSLHIYPKEIRGHFYYYAQRNWREKPKGKPRGSAKSRVRNETLYLGTAESDWLTCCACTSPAVAMASPAGSTSYCP